MMADRRSTRTVIVDDEPLARKRLKDLLQDDPRFLLAGEAETGNDAVRLIRDTTPDLVFLDVQMPGLDGFGVIRALDVQNVPLIVFVTAFDQHAIRAFEVSAIDYLLKPVTEARFRAALDRVQDRLNDPRLEITTRLLGAVERLASREKPDRIPIRNSTGTHFVQAADVDWAEVEDDYIRLHTGSESHLLRESMGQLEERLASGNFVRIHRSLLVNVDRVKQIRPHLKGDYVLILHDGTRLISGRTYRQKIQQLME